jgi:excinuclease ABC subunit A
MVIPIAKSSRFDPNTYRAACPTCNGVGSLQQPNPNKLIKSPDRPLCGGAMYSPGFFPKGYLCKPGNNGYDIIQAFARRHGFDPFTTPWKEVPVHTRNMFYYGDPNPLEVTFRSKSERITTRRINFSGFYGWIRDWDIGGTYTNNVVCLDCNGARLKPEYLAVKLLGYNIHQLSTISLDKLKEIINKIQLPTTHIAYPNLQIIRRRLSFLNKVGLGYINLSRVSATLSAGEAQRIKLAGLLGSEMNNLTIILDEPSRGLHPREVDALFEALSDLKKLGNTVIVVEHDLEIIDRADHIIDLGPGPGKKGGEIVAEGTPEEIKQTSSVTGKWLSKKIYQKSLRKKNPSCWMIIEGAEENNLKGETVRIPLNALVGICGVSGSGKSTLVVDTIGRILAPIKHTTSVAREPFEPGKYKKIVNGPKKALIVDQSKKRIHSPAKFMNIDKKIFKVFAESTEARALGLDEKKIRAKCTVCNGAGFIQLDMGFLPNIFEDCESCNGTGYAEEAWNVKLKGYSLPEITQLTIEEIYELFRDYEKLAEPLKEIIDVGLGYLVLHQPGYSLSGGEAQRLKIAKELAKKTSEGTLYILDEPTLGQHMEDIERLINILHRLVLRGNSVLVVEHHPTILANCDWLIELGPEGGEEGGYIIAAGPPNSIIGTPTSQFLKKQLVKTNELDAITSL